MSKNAFTTDFAIINAFLEAKGSEFRTTRSRTGWLYRKCAKKGYTPNCVIPVFDELPDMFGHYLGDGILPDAANPNVGPEKQLAAVKAVAKWILLRELPNAEGGAR